MVPGPSLPTPSVPTKKLSLVKLDTLAGMPYKTQFHLVVPSPGSVVIKSAYSFVPAGAFDHASAGVEPVPSQV